MSAGQEFIKKIKPIGCIFFILLMVLFLIMCFTSAPKSIPGYEPLHNSEYYSQNDTTLAELKTELQTNVFPQLEGNESCTISNGKLTLALEDDHYTASRATILIYYDKNLFEFTDIEQ